MTLRIGHALTLKPNLEVNLVIYEGLKLKLLIIISDREKLVLVVRSMYNPTY